MRKYKLRKHKIANSLLRNYIFLALTMIFLIIITSFIVSIFAFALYFNTPSSFSVTDASSLMNDDYTKIDYATIENLGGYADVLDKNNNIIYSQGNSPNDKSKYTIEDFNKIILSSSFEVVEDGYIYRSAYNKDKDFLLVVAIPENYDTTIPKHKLTPKIFGVISAFCGLLILALFFIIYSRLSSRNFVKPLSALTEGAKIFAKGDYSARINISSNNEFGELRDAFNTMAEKIQKETTLREESEEARRRLILDISHDLKNPLSSILGYSNLLLSEEVTPEESSKYLEIINNNSERANELIQDLFDFSKLQSTDFKLTLEDTDICEFLREAIAFYIPEIEEKEFLYDFDIDDDSFFIPMDKKHLWRALSNLINNSLKYNPKGTFIKISGNKINHSFKIVIEDTGIGIPKDLQTEIFHPFVRVDDSRNSKSGGSGLGLAIAKNIIEKHGGIIELLSEKDLGCKFIIFLYKDNT